MSLNNPRPQLSVQSLVPETFSVLLALLLCWMSPKTFEETHSGFSHGDAVVPHVELLVHLHRFIDGVLQGQQSTEELEQRAAVDDRLQFDGLTFT